MQTIHVIPDPLATEKLELDEELTNPKMSFMVALFIGLWYPMERNRPIHTLKHPIY